MSEPSDRRQRFLEFLATEVWPLVPVEERGRVLPRSEEDEILGFGSDGV